MKAILTEQIYDISRDGFIQLSISRQVALGLYDLLTFWGNL
jgi:hypothetical protein